MISNAVIEKYIFVADVTIRNCPYAYYLHRKIERSNVNQGSDETLCKMGGIVPGGIAS